MGSRSRWNEPQRCLLPCLVAMCAVRGAGHGHESPSHVLQVLVVFVAVPMMLLAGFGAVISLFVRYRRAREEERQQIKWFASAAALTLVWMLVFGVIVGELLSAEGGVPEVIVAFTSVSSLLVIPSIAIAT